MDTTIYYSLAPDNTKHDSKLAMLGDCNNAVDFKFIWYFKSTLHSFNIRTEKGKIVIQLSKTKSTPSLMSCLCYMTPKNLHDRRRCSRLPFRRLTGNDVSGPLFSQLFSLLFFFFFSFHFSVIFFLIEGVLGSKNLFNES